LLERARLGDAAALDALLLRYLPRLRRWAAGRLPAGARGALDTDDVVQETIVKAVRHLDQLEIRDAGALQAYLRQALNNRFVDAYRHAKRHPAETDVDSAIPAEDTSPLEAAIGRETLDRYEAALKRLQAVDRRAVILRVELCYDYDEIAEMLGKSSAAAARVAVSRALARLSREMRA
jgi:RNA polymerase sigma-70 factor (ECF subfamily)